MNHTYTHPFLGCVQNTAVTPWTCTKNAAYAIQYMSRAEISAQIRDNNNWAAAKGITTDRTELVTGEHSGLKTAPQQPVDNPNLVAPSPTTGSSGRAATTPANRHSGRSARPSPSPGTR